MLISLVATTALRAKKNFESQLDAIAGRRLMIESQVSFISFQYKDLICSSDWNQVNSIESANMNKETLAAIKKGADVLKGIHGKL